METAEAAAALVAEETARVEVAGARHEAGGAEVLAPASLAEVEGGHLLAAAGRGLGGRHAVETGHALHGAPLEHPAAPQERRRR